MRQEQKTRRVVPRMDETARQREAEEFEERLQRARRASKQARRTALAAGRLVAQVDRMV